MADAEPTEKAVPTPEERELLRDAAAWKRRRGAGLASAKARRDKPKRRGESMSSSGEGR